MPLAAGDRLGPYEIIAQLGAGGMGEVYRATDTRLGRQVALKVLPDGMAKNPERLARFQREAKALAALEHPGIVTVYSVEEVDGVHFFTMQLVEWQSLDALIAAGPISFESMGRIGIALAEALGAAHRKGIVHRDLKPANIMVATDGRVKILDFGLAQMTGTEVVDRSRMPTERLLTLEGAVMGTVPYMSPEQVRGQATDHRTDIFSLGIVLYEMACGKRPFAGRSAAELGSAILRDTPPPLTTLRAGLPRSLEQVVGRCLEKDSGSRFQSMLDVRDTLEAGSEPRGNSRAAAGPGSRRRSRLLKALGAFLLIAATTILVWRLGFLRAGSPAAPPRIRSIAVLPLDNYSGDPDQEYFAEGMTDELTADLARLSQVRVISRGSAMQFKGDHRPSTPEIAKILDVDAVVEGSVLRSGDRVRITAQLIDARADRHLWAQSFERSSQDVLALQDDLASAIAREIHVQISPAETSQLGSAPSVDPEAFDAYLKGRYFFNRPDDANLQKAIERFEEAIALDPDFVPALSGLSDVYLWEGYNEGFLTASEAKPKAKEAAERAIRLDDNSAEAHTSLAVFKLFYEYDWVGSEAEFRRAIALNPNYAYAHDQFAIGLAFQGRFEESISESRRAEELDPLNPQIPIDSIFAFAWLGHWDAAEVQIARAAKLDPTNFFPAWANGWLSLQEGKIPDAVSHFQEAKAMGAPAFTSAWLAYAYGASGDRARAKVELEALKKLSLHGAVTPFNQAVVSLGLGDNARAVSYLEQAYAADSQWLGWLKWDRIFDPLRSDPRFVDLMTKLGFTG